MAKSMCCLAFYGSGLCRVNKFTFRLLCFSSLLASGICSADAVSAPGLNDLHPQKFELPVQTKKVVVFDDGSTGSRIMALCFGRNHDEEEFKLLGQSKMYDKGSPLAQSNGITEDTVEVIGELLSNPFCRTEGSPEPEFFLGATAGQRSNGKEAQKLFRMIKDKLEAHPVTRKYKKINLKLLNGWEEGAYNWLAVNYTQNQLDIPLGSYGIVEMGGGSTQMAFRIPHFTLESATSQTNASIEYSIAQTDADYVVFDRPSTNDMIEVFSESKMGFGLKYGYNKYILQKERTGLSCDPGYFNAGGNYEKCAKAMKQVFDDPDDKYGPEKFQERNAILSKYLPDTFYLSGYFYDYTVAMGLPSHLRIDELESAAEYACTHFNPGVLKEAADKGDSDLFGNFSSSLIRENSDWIVTAPESFQFSGSVPPVNNERFCAHITFMAAMLRLLGITEQQRLIIVKSLSFEGKSYPATWTPGYAIAWANGWLDKKRPVSE